MAVLDIDHNKIELVVKVGVLENYQPDDDIKSLHKEIQDLRERLKKNAKRIIGATEDQMEAVLILKKDNDKKEAWLNYINNTYTKQMKAIKEKIKEKNREICPNFDEFLNLNK